MPNRLPTTPSRLPPSVWLATGLGVGLVAPAPGTFGAAIGFAAGLGNQLSARLRLAVRGDRRPESRRHSALHRRRPGAGRQEGQSGDHLGRNRHHAGRLSASSRSPTGRSRSPASCCTACSTSPSRRRPASSKRLPDGLGVMADDCMAAIYACLALYLPRARLRLSWHLLTG